MTTSASSTESTAATSATTITTAATTSVTNIADEDLCSWAINDYQKKAGIVPANAEITARSEETCEITLTDENGNVLEVAFESEIIYRMMSATGALEKVNGAADKVAPGYTVRMTHSSGGDDIESTGRALFGSNFRIEN